MSLKERIGEHLLCVAIDLAEAQKELADAHIKVRDLASKYNDLIDMKNELDKNDNSNNISFSDVPVFNDPDFTKHT